jgi:predicted nucleic-acid-binding protein
MNGIDTHILVRFFARDDKVQAKQAEVFLGKRCSPANPGWISVIVLCKMVCFLSRGYSYSKDQLLPVIDHLLRAPFLKLEDEAAVRTALGIWENLILVTWQEDRRDALSSLTGWKPILQSTSAKPTALGFPPILPATSAGRRTARADRPGSGG